MKLTRRQKYNSSFLRKFNPLPCKEKLNLGTARLVLNHYMAVSLFKNADQDPSGQKLIKTCSVYWGLNLTGWGVEKGQRRQSSN